ncbi:MAG: Hsp70 family protein [Pseudonocardiaceae bacterium]
MKAIGIDLGTTNSAVAGYDPERAAASILANGDGENLTPSVVGVRRRDGEEGELLVGRNALNWAARLPKDTVRSVKRLMGRDYADPTVAEARGRLSYEIVPGSAEDPRAHVLIAGRPYTPSQVSGMILKRLKQDASRTLGEEVTHAVITVPASFGNAQRAATREAGEQAGLVVKKVIDEPTAAAVAFGVQLPQQARHRVLVYDLGGGTFDISILHAVKDGEGRSHFQVLDHIGDSWLGGDDFDLTIVGRIIDWVKKRCDVDPSEDRIFLFHAKNAAELAKKQLSQMSQADIVIPAAFRPAEGGPPIDVDMTISRDEYLTMIEPLVEKTMSLVREALGRQELSADDITDVLLVGGATLTPKVYEAVENFFGKKKVRRDINPMECVALGAGILAGTLHGVECPECKNINDEAAKSCVSCNQSLANAREVGDTGLYERTGKALGIAVVKGSRRDVFVPIIPRGTPYPLPEPITRPFKATDRGRIRVPVYEGDDLVASKNAEVGVVEYELPKEIDSNSRVDVTFNYDSSRIITVKISVAGLSKEDTLRTDTHRTPPAQPIVDDEDSGSRRAHLVDAAASTRQFLAQYEQYIEPMQLMKIRRDLEQAQQAQSFSDDAECQRMINILHQDRYNSGLATQLLLAERATDGATPEVARDINQAVASLQQSFQRGRHDQVGEQARILKVLVARARVDRRVAEIPDETSSDGLLKEWE